MNLIYKSDEKPYVKPLLLKRKGTQVSYQYFRSYVVETGRIELRFCAEIALIEGYDSAKP